MKIILLRNIDNLGKKGEVKEVTDGFARNFLLPKKMAMIATAGAIKMIGQIKKKGEKKKKKELENVRELLKTPIEITIKAKANEEGHLFAGIGAREISKALGQAIKTKIEPDIIQLDKKIKALGEYRAGIKVGERKGEVKVRVKKEE